MSVHSSPDTALTVGLDNLGETVITIGICKLSVSRDLRNMCIGVQQTLFEVFGPSASDIEQSATDGADCVGTFVDL